MEQRKTVNIFGNSIAGNVQPYIGKILAGDLFLVELRNIYKNIL